MGSTNTATVPDNSSFLQHIDFRYNAKGLLTRINNPNSLTDETYGNIIDVFSEQLDYDVNNNGYAITPNYNGNISSMSWQTKVNSNAPGPPAQEKKGFVYNYDPLNRLMNGVSKANSGDNQYNEALQYDELGNILSLIRNNGAITVLNSMKYNYMNAGARSNRLMNITNGVNYTENQATNYIYDSNGNLTGDSKKGLTTTPLTYNELNLPQTVNIVGSPNKSISYVYNAAGVKLQRTITVNGSLVENSTYDGGIEYVTNDIEFIHTTEGRVLPQSGGPYLFEYNVTDHLGNIRAMFGDKNNDGLLASDEIVQTTDYYTFGRELISSTVIIPNTDNKYKNNGKEFQADLVEYDYGSRFYDALIGRWNVVDPVADKYSNHSPYNYVFNNPVLLTDPDGRDVIGNSDGSVTFNNDNTPDAYNAFQVLTNQSKNVYVDVEGDKDRRRSINSGNKTGSYGSWAVFSVSSLHSAVSVLNIFADKSLDNLAIESHGKFHNQSVMRTDDEDQSVKSNNNISHFITTGLVNEFNSGTYIERVAELKELSEKLKDGGNFIFAVCDVGKGQNGKDFGQALENLTGNRLNVFLPTALIDPVDYPTSNGPIRALPHDFEVQTTGDGWLKVSPNCGFSNFKSITIMPSCTNKPINIIK